MPLDLIRRRVVYGADLPKNYQGSSDHFEPNIKIDWKQSLGYPQGTIWHELAHASSGFLGSSSDPGYANYHERSMQELMQKARWKFNQSNRMYEIDPQSPAFDGWEYDDDRYIRRQLSMKECIGKPGCNPYTEYQFTDPREMFATWSEYYVDDSKSFCFQLPTYCPVMKDFYDNREYKSGVWINRPGSGEDQ